MYYEVFKLPSELNVAPSQTGYRRVHVGETALDNNTPHPDEHEQVLEQISRELNLGRSAVVRFDVQYVYLYEETGWTLMFDPETIDDCELPGLILKLGSVVLAPGNERSGVIDQVEQVLGSFPVRNPGDAERIIKQTVAGAADELVRIGGRWFTQSALRFAVEHPGRAVVGMWLEGL